MRLEQQRVWPKSGTQPLRNCTQPHEQTSSKQAQKMSQQLAPNSSNKRPLTRRQSSASAYNIQTQHTLLIAAFVFACILIASLVPGSVQVKSSKLNEHRRVSFYRQRGITATTLSAHEQAERSIETKLMSVGGFLSPFWRPGLCLAIGLAIDRFK